MKSYKKLKSINNIDKFAPIIRCLNYWSIPHGGNLKYNQSILEFKKVTPYCLSFRLNFNYEVI